MKVMKRVMMVMLAVAMLLVTEYVPVHADSIKGQTESSAVELKSGKKKTGKFWTGTASSVYYVIALPAQGKLSVAFSAKSLGTGATIELRKADIANWKQQKEISYDKKKKVTSGKLTADYILQKGTYVIQITPGKVIKSTKKFTITAKYTASKFEDAEPNDKEETAQSLNIYDKKAHKMYLTTGNPIESPDLTDCYKLELKDTKTLNIALSSKANMDDVKVLVREKTDTGYNTIKSYDFINGKVSESLKLSKGTYYLKVWCSNDSIQKQMPYTMKCTAK